MTERELRGITPTYQNLLINQLNTIITAINDGNQLYAFRCLRTLIISLNPTHKKDLVENDVKHLQKEVDGINQIKAVDYETTRIKRRDAARSLAPRVIELYEKVMEILHKHGYLEVRGHKYPTGHEKGLKEILQTNQ